MYQVPATPRDCTLATPTPKAVPTPEAVYWTSSDDVRSVLRDEVELLLSVDSSVRGEEQLQVGSLIVGLADILFDGFKVHIDSLQ